MQIKLILIKKFLPVNILWKYKLYFIYFFWLKIRNDKRAIIYGQKYITVITNNTK